MEKSLYSIKLDGESKENQPFFRCNECKGTFQKPLATTFSSRGYVQKYNACPRCLSKVTIVRQHEGDEEKETLPIGNFEKAKSQKRNEENAICKHFVGYLKTRPKDMSIPDECLTCDKMIECLLR